MIGAKELREALLGYEKRKMQKEQLFLDKKAQVADKLKSFIPAIAKAFSVPKSKFIVRFDGKIPSINTTESGDTNLGLGSCFVNLQMYSEDIITAFIKYADLHIHLCQASCDDPDEIEEIVSQYMLTDDFLRGVYRILKKKQQWPSL